MVKAWLASLVMAFVLCSPAYAADGKGGIWGDPPDHVAGRAIVIDADTLHFRKDGRKVKVRLFGVDAPEMQTLEGVRARGVMDDIIRRREVSCLIFGTDLYARKVGVCKVDGNDIAEELLATGHAWTDRRYLTGKPQEFAYLDAEREARRTKAGLWAAHPDR